VTRLNAIVFGPQDELDNFQGQVRRRCFIPTPTPGAGPRLEFCAFPSVTGTEATSPHLPLEVVEFVLGPEHYALSRVTFAKSIPHEFTPVPCTPALSWGWSMSEGKSFDHQYQEAF